MEVVFLVLNSKGEIDLINQKGCEILRYKQDELIGKNWIDNFLPKSVRESIRVAFAKAIAGEIGTHNDYENYVLTKDGDERLISWNNSLLLNDDNEIEAIISSGEDITLQRDVKELLQKNDYFKK